MKEQHFSYGGQAVLEGVMMRGQHQASVAVRQPDGTIALKHFPLEHQKRNQWERLPLLRGVILLWDMLNLGTKALNFSANVATGEQHEPSKRENSLSLLIALAFAVGLFFVLPMLLAGLAGYMGASLLTREIIESGLRLGLIIAYVVVIGRIPEIQRVFAYHGAEHKVVNAYEAGLPLNVSTARDMSLIHPRCGTSFLAVVIVISFFTFFLIGGLPFWVRLLSRIILVPLIAAMAYEVIRMSAGHYHRSWVRSLLAPSLAFQKLTTREPDEGMIETAITALQAVLKADGVVVKNSSLAQSDETVFAVQM